MRRLLASVFVVALLGQTAVPVAAAEQPRIERATKRVSTDLAAWRAADQALKSSHRDAEKLARQIDAVRDEGRRAELERLLQASVRLSNQLETQARQRKSRARALQSAVSAALGLFNGEISRLQPRLATGSRAAQQRTRRAIKQLLIDRRALKKQVLAAARPAKTNKRWKQYEVQVDPLDGPDDLQAKIDFLRDTRDKFRKKLRELAILKREARQAEMISRAATNFRTDVSHFDEEQRTQRVRRQQNGLSSVSPRSASSEQADESSPTVLSGAGSDDQPADAAPNRGTGGAASPEPGAGFDGEPGTSQDATGGNAPPAAPTDPSGGGGSANETTANNGSTQTDGDAANGGTGPTAPPPAAAGFTGQFPRQLDPNALLNLDVASIGIESNVQRLDALMNDLAQLEAYLEARAREVERRRRQLEGDEARALENE